MVESYARLLGSILNGLTFVLYCALAPVDETWIIIDLTRPFEAYPKVSVCLALADSVSFLQGNVTPSLKLPYTNGRNI